MQLTSAKSRLSALLLLLGMSLLSAPLLARDYLIEVVLFENVQGQTPAASGLYVPKTTRALGLGSDAARAAGFELISEGLSLEDSAAKIRASGRYRLLTHLAWRQPGLDAGDAKAIRINLGGAIPVYIPDDSRPYDQFIPASAQPQTDRTRQLNTTALSGTIKVRLGRFLHMETQLAFTDSERLQSFRLSQSRKMRSRELHYIDNPRFGLLTRILPIEDEVDDSQQNPVTDVDAPTNDDTDNNSTDSASDTSG